MEYASLSWMSASPTHLGLLDNIQKKALKIIGEDQDTASTKLSIPSLGHRKQVVCKRSRNPPSEVKLSTRWVNLVRMFELGSRLAHMYLSSGPGEPTGSLKNSSVSASPAGVELAKTKEEKNKEEKIPNLEELLQHIRRLSGLKKEDVFCNLRVPNQFQTSRQEINLIILSGAGVYCMDVKPWRGVVSAPAPNAWHIQVKEEEQNFTNTSIQQIPDPLQSITMKTRDLCSYMQQCGVNIKPTLFLPRILFLSPHCHLDMELRKRKDLVSHGDMEMFLCSLREGYITWIRDTITPSWISGHLSFRQMGAVRDVLGRLGTWDVVQLRGGTELKGDFQGCQHLALDRQETDVLEFSRGWSLGTETLWALLGHTPQVTVRMYKRGAHSWLGKPLSGMATIPSNTHIMFRISGDDKDAKIPANSIHTITLSI
ncbi:uncharacterized protein si:zfos-911d5.4 [Neoarius graeffei]|uniref:uncharacterized protein si:zfos-911d5.4 n=1 Tax=Neoarius graeffei TaxID=443677 RepID=UPI00298C7BB1|nr:uncharacterized protein si:zfos-911d5.4 [Neoarius graeffei]